MGKLTFVLLFSTFFGYAQIEDSFDSNGTGNLDLSSFAYPMFLGKEQHSYFLVNYKISQKLEVDLQGFYDTYLTSNRLRTSLILKRYLTNKFYLFSGIEVEAADQKSIFSAPPPRIGVLTGFGYDFTENFLIEGKFNAQVNDSPMGAYGEPFAKMPRVYTIGGRIKF